MGIEELDLQVYKTLRYFTENSEKISVRKIANQIGKPNSLRSVQLSIERLIKEGKLLKTNSGEFSLREEGEYTNIKTKGIPLLGSIACGGPIFAEENIEAYIPIGVDIVKESNTYFLLRTKGDSMNKLSIENGDIVLIKQQNTANNGDIVVALIDDEATLKEFKIENGIVKLIPHSTNPDNKIIIVTDDLIIQGVYERNLGRF